MRAGKTEPTKQRPAGRVNEWGCVMSVATISRSYRFLRQGHSGQKSISAEELIGTQFRFDRVYILIEMLDAKLLSIRLLTHLRRPRKSGRYDNDLTDNGLMPLHIAAGAGHDVVVRTLIEAGAKFNNAMDNGLTLLRVAGHSGHQGAGASRGRRGQPKANIGYHVTKS